MSDNVATETLTSELVAWVREYARRRINSRMMDARECIPPHVILDFGNRGLMGMRFAREHGGLELDLRQFHRVIQQLAAVDMSLALLVAMHNGSSTYSLRQFASPTTRDELLPRLAQGRILAAFAITEPGAGSDASNLQATARRDGDGWRLNGDKMFTALAGWASIITVLARTVGESGEPGELTAFLVREGAPGLQVGPEFMSMGTRALLRNSLSLRDVWVDSRDMLGQPGGGLTIISKGLHLSRLTIAAVALGTMKRCAQMMLRYARHRTFSWGRLDENPVSLVRLGEVTASIAAVESAMEACYEGVDRGRAAPPLAFAACKVAATELLWQCTDRLVQMLGGRGYGESNHAPRLMRDARMLRITEGPSEALTTWIGTVALHRPELDRFVAGELGQPDLAGRFREAMEALAGRMVDPRDPFALAWARWCAGNVAVHTLLLAALVWRATLHPELDLASAIEWARSELDAVTRRGLGEHGPAPRPEDGDALRRRIEAYTATAADIEQTLPVQDWSVDPLVRG